MTNKDIQALNIVYQARSPEATAWEDVDAETYAHAEANGFEVRKLFTKTAPECQHRIADARNPVVQSGYLCVYCGALFSAADHGLVPAFSQQGGEIIGWYKDKQIDAHEDSQNDLPPRWINHRVLVEGRTAPSGDGWKPLVESAHPPAGAEPVDSKPVAWWRYSYLDEDGSHDLDMYYGPDPLKHYIDNGHPWHALYAATQPSPAPADAVPAQAGMQGDVPVDKQIQPYMTYRLSNRLLNDGWTFSGDNPHGSVHEAAKAAGFLKHEHPNLDVPIDPACSAKLDDLGDDRGQGLDGYWKWGFRAGWYHAQCAASQDSERDAARYRKVRNNAYRYGVGRPTPEELDADVDAAMAAQQGEKVK